MALVLLSFTSRVGKTKRWTSSFESKNSGMVRNEIKIGKIDKLPARQVTFSKMRRGLFRKAAELSALCESEVAVVICSATGKLYDFSSSSIKDVIARYKVHTAGGEPPELQLENENRLRSTKEVKDKSRQLRQMNGEDLAHLDLNQLEELENSIRARLDRVIKTKEEKILNEIVELAKKGVEMFEANNLLRQRVVMLSNKGNTPGLLEPNHNLIAVNNNRGIAEEDGMPAETATNITCNSGASLDDDLSPTMGIP